MVVFIWRGWSCWEYLENRHCSLTCTAPLLTCVILIVPYLFFRKKKKSRLSTTQMISLATRELRLYVFPIIPIPLSFSPCFATFAKQTATVARSPLTVRPSDGREPASSLPFLCVWHIRVATLRVKSAKGVFLEKPPPPWYSKLDFLFSPQQTMRLRRADNRPRGELSGGGGELGQIKIPPSNKTPDSIRRLRNQNNQVGAV